MKLFEQDVGKEWGSSYLPLRRRVTRLILLSFSGRRKRTEERRV